MEADSVRQRDVPKRELENKDARPTCKRSDSHFEVRVRARNIVGAIPPQQIVAVTAAAGNLGGNEKNDSVTQTGQLTAIYRKPEGIRRNGQQK